MSASESIGIYTTSLHNKNNELQLNQGKYSVNPSVKITEPARI